MSGQRRVCAGLLLGMGLVWSAAVGAQEKRVIAVGVVDEKGEPVAELTAKNFRGRYRGEAVKIISAEPVAGPRRIVVLLDMSESMDGAPGKWSYAQTAFQGLIAHGAEGARLALVTFDGAPEKRIGFEEWNAEAGLALAELEKPGKLENNEGPIHISWAEKIAREMLGEPRPGDVLFIISDGWRVGHALPPPDRDELRPLSCDGVRYFTFDFYERGSGAWDLSPLARATGGEALHAVFGGAIRDRVSKAYVPLEGVPASLIQFYRQMGEVYRVEVELPRALDKPREWELEVVEAASIGPQGVPQGKPIGPQSVPQGEGKKRKDVRVVYPRKLVPCGEKSD